MLKRKRQKRTIAVGDKFGKLTVLETRPDGLVKGIIKVECECGDIRFVSADNIWYGNSKSCGRNTCSTRGQTLREMAGYKEPGEQARNFIYLNYQSIARQRNREWNLEFEDFCWFTSQDCYYCGAKPSNATKDRHGEGAFVYNGLDRIDSSRGYVRENIVPACIVCNRAKTDISQDEFLSWARRIAEKHKL